MFGVEGRSEAFGEARSHADVSAWLERI